MLPRKSEPMPLTQSIRGSPCLLIVIYDPSKRAPASEGDVLGFMSLGCLMENMWLMAQSLGICFQILSAFAAPPVEKQVKQILGIPEQLRIAYACRLGHPNRSIQILQSTPRNRRFHPSQQIWKQRHLSLLRLS